ncbi:MAG: putative zinc-binding protein [Candidatus Eremiobacterota bacterium]
MNKKAMIFPCSGIGKVSGTIARDSVREVVHKLKDSTEGPCLALLTVGDEETVKKVKENPSITVDGCPKACALKNVEKSGGKIEKSFMVMDYMREHKELKPGTVTEPGEDGRKLASIIASDISVMVKEIEGRG